MNRKGLAVLSVSAIFASLTTIGATHQSHSSHQTISFPKGGFVASSSQLFMSTVSSNRVSERKKKSTPIQPLNVTVLAARDSSLSDLTSRSATLATLQQETKSEVVKARINSVSALSLSSTKKSSEHHSSSQSQIHSTTSKQTAKAKKKTVHKAKVKNTPKAKASKKTTSHNVIKPASRDVRAASIAVHYVGVPYKWGGTSPAGFDCSGLVRYVYARVGVSLPHSSYAMFHTGSPVSRNGLRVGDMVFFDTDGKGASHVGIYVGGNRFVSAAGSSVRVSSISGYWAQHYIGARQP